MAVKPRDGGRTEKVSLDSAATHILEVLFGFQLIAVFSEGFAEKLSAAVALLWIVLPRCERAPRSLLCAWP